MGNNTYEIIKELENSPNFLKLLKRGVIPITIFDKKVYYERFQKELKQGGNRWQAIIITSDEFGVSEMTIRRAIKFMEK